MPVYRFDLAGLSSDEVEELKIRLGIVDFMIDDKKSPDYLDLYTQKEIDPAALLNGLNKIKYIDYSHIPFESWKYPFA